MSPEELILKYIDGELNAYEDDLLREVIRDNSDAKELFDSYIEMHLAMQEDANDITVPENVYNETEDLVMMKIMEEEPKVSLAVNNRIAKNQINFGRYLFTLPSINLKSNFNYQFAGTLAAMLLIFIGFSKIDEGKLPLLNDLSFTQEQIVDNPSTNTSNNNENLDESEKQKVAPANSLVKTNEIPSITSTENSEQIQILSTNNEIIQNDALLISDENSDVNNNNTETLNEINNFGNPINALDKLEVNKSSLESKYSSPVNNSVNYNNSIVDNIYALTNLESPLSFNQVQLTSFAAIDYFTNGINTDQKIQISNFSQSIAYAANTKDRFGLEFGYTQYTVLNDINVKLPGGTFILNPEDLDILPGYFKSKIPVRFFWGTAFYERTLIDYKGFSMNGRIGGGASTGGPMAYLRFFARQKVINGVYITIGSEGRVFKTDHPILNSEILNTSGSFIYGLQFQF